MESNVIIRQIVEPDEETVNILTGWLYHWWGQQEGYLREAVRQYVRNSCQQQRLPRTYGLFVDGQPAGMYQLRLEDLFVRPDLYPWLANVYLLPAYRGKGYGRLLLTSAAEAARQLDGFESLYLYTTHAGLYERFGWQLVGEIDTFLEGARMQRLYRLNL